MNIDIKFCIKHTKLQRKFRRAIKIWRLDHWKVFISEYKIFQKMSCSPFWQYLQPRGIASSARDSRWAQSSTFPSKSTSSAGKCCRVPEESGKLINSHFRQFFIQWFPPFSFPKMYLCNIRSSEQSSECRSILVVLELTDCEFAHRSVDVADTVAGLAVQFLKHRFFQIFTNSWKYFQLNEVYEIDEKRRVYPYSVGQNTVQ